MNSSQLRSRQNDDAILSTPTPQHRREAAFYSSPVDDRVRCCDCGLWTGQVGVSNRYIVDGNEEEEWYNVTTCRLRKGHDPDIMRRCDYYRPKEKRHGR